MLFLSERHGNFSAVDGDDLREQNGVSKKIIDPIMMQTDTEKDSVSLHPQPFAQRDSSFRIHQLFS